MSEQSTLIEGGITLMLSGMTTVFLFLLLLIVSIYLLKIIFSIASSKVRDISSGEGKVISATNETHQKIIHEVLDNIRS